MTLNSPQKTSTALIVEGGGMRGIFAAGVLDAFLENEFNPFDMYYGVSVGASVLSSFLAKQYKRHFHIFTEIAPNPGFISFKRMLKGGSYMDLDWLWDTVESIRPLDTHSADKNLIGKSCYIVCTGVNSGDPFYLSPQGRDWIETLKASSSIPLLYRHFPMIMETPMADGGIADPIPIKEAYRKGANHVVIIRSRPLGVYKSTRLGPIAGKLIFNGRKNLQKKLRFQSDLYNETLQFVDNPPDDLTVTQIAPSSMATGRMTTQLDALLNDYMDGMAMGLKTLNQLNTTGKNKLAS